MMRDKRAVSPVVGTILMMAITIILATSLYAWVCSLHPDRAIPSATFFDVDVIEVNGYKVLAITVTANVQNTRWNQIEIMVDDERLVHNVDDRILAGDTIYVYNDGHTLRIGETLEEVGQNVKGDVGTDMVLVKIIDMRSNAVIFEKEIVLS